MNDALPKTHRNRWQLIITGVTLLALAILIYFSRESIAGTVRNLGRVNGWALLLMLPIQAVNYHAYTKLYQDFFRILGHRIRYGVMLPVVFELNFVNNVFPSGGVTGISYFGLRLREEGITAGKSTLAQIMKFALVFISFQILLLLGLLILALNGQVNNLTILVAGSLATLLVIGTLATAYIIGSKQRINATFTLLTRVLNRIIHVVRPNNPETINIDRARVVFTDLHENYVLLQSRWWELKMPLVYALLANLAEVLTIYVVYIAFGNWVNPGAVIIAYAIANFAGTISVLPGGVGIYEALMTAVLVTAGVPPGVSIPVTVMYRILNMAIQLPPGYYFYQRALQPQPRHG